MPKGVDRDMKVKEVMSKELIVTYVPGTVKDALRTLAKHNVSGMPVLRKGTKELAGVVTRSDIFRNPNEEQLALIMSSEPFVIGPDDDVKKAAKLFYENRIHGLPVINNKKELFGIISPRDLLRLVVERNNRLVESYLSNVCVPVYQETPLPVLMEIITITNESALPVLNDDLKLAGIVTDGDLFKLSHIKESVSASNLGLGDDEDAWTWEGIRDVLRLYYSTSKVDLPQVPVKEIMVTDVSKAFRKTPISEVAQTMLKKQISQVPVVDSDERLVGMVTDIDLMRAVYEKE
ncbi:MAG TPA: CBS domain-containing protein [Thermoplasmatales archaeon]|nr:CBS domain-containing protein [Thermoplasmatales archaeon]